MRGDAFFIEVSRQPPFTKLHPRVAGFFKGYFAREKVVRFGDRHVVNTQFPPYPSPAFDNLAEGFAAQGDADQRRLYSVTLAVTNRCRFRCWHCYNAGRDPRDLPLGVWKTLAGELQRLGAVMVTLTGGEPLLRDDLEEIVGQFDPRSCLVLGTTGDGLTAERAADLRARGLFAVGISLDAADAETHDRLRGRAGAFRSALRAIAAAREAGLYAYVVSVATREFLDPARFYPFLRFARSAGALEVHLLEPSASGRLAGRTDATLSEAERRRILDYQEVVAQDEDLPILSSYAYLEGAEAFGCGAGLTHLYVDGSGEVSPCQLVPLSFGNVGRQPLGEILRRMACHFSRPRTECVGRCLAGRLPDGPSPRPPEVSDQVCRQCLPREHPLPQFFAIRSEARDEVGVDELRAAYDRVHGEYDGFWLTEAARPIDDLLARLAIEPDARVFEAGCGTGYATVRLAAQAGHVVAADLSEGMLAEARRRLDAAGVRNVSLVAGDALEALSSLGEFDLVCTSWALGYIRLAPFFAAAAGALAPGGRLALIVHLENSPRRPLEIFAELVARDPTVLRKRVAFDFPRDMGHLAGEISAAGLDVEQIWQDAVVFRYDRPADVLEHLLKSGAGTAFYDAIDPARRGVLTHDFLALLAAGHDPATAYEVRHDFVACIAVKARGGLQDG